MAVNAWLALGDVHVEFSLGNDGVGRISTGGYGLFGALASQLTLATARAEGLTVCTAQL